MERQTTEEMIDDCIAEALAMPGAKGTDAPEMRSLKRDLHETTARLASASPYMQPSEDLRGRILQATAPATFRMEDYRKAMKDNSRYYKWGFYAAMLFMMAAGWYNLSVGSHNESLQRDLASHKEQIRGLQGLNGEILATLSTFVTPDVQQITLVDADKKPWAKAWVDDTKKHAVMIMPQELVAGNSGELIVTRDNVKVTYKTTVLAVPASQLAGRMPHGITIQAALNVQNVSPDTGMKPPMTATMGP